MTDRQTNLQTGMEVHREGKEGSLSLSLTCLKCAFTLKDLHFHCLIFAISSAPTDRGTNQFHKNVPIFKVYVDNNLEFEIYVFPKA